MSFRQFGGINYAPKHNIVASNYNTSNNLLVTQNVGQPNSYINFLSDISGNINIYGDLDISGNLNISGDIDCSGNISGVSGKFDHLSVGIGALNTFPTNSLDISGNVLLISDITNTSNTQIGYDFAVISTTAVASPGVVNTSIGVLSNGFQLGFMATRGPTFTSGLKNFFAIFQDALDNGDYNPIVQENDHVLVSGIYGSGSGLPDASGGIVICPWSLTSSGARMDVSGNFTFTGNTQMNGTLSVSQSTTLTGNVGIGTTPSSYNGITFPFNTSANGYGITWGGESNYSRIYDNTNLHIYTDDDMYFDTGNYPGTTRLYIENTTGYIGINNTSPIFTLDVSGNSRITGNTIIGKYIQGQTTEHFNVTISSNNIGTYGSGLTGNASIQLNGNNDYALINYVSSSIDQGYLQIGTGDNGTEPIYITTANGSTGYPNMRIDSGAVWINPSGDGNFPNTISNYGLNVNGQVTATSFQSSSDYRLKTNIKQINNKYSIDNLNPVEYDMNDRHDMGFLAHEIQEHYPFLVDGEKDGEKMQSINYNGLIALLVKEIQGLKNEIKELKHNI